MTQIKSNIPKIRFKEFSQEWEEKKLGDIYPKIRNGFVGIATPYYVKEGIKYLQGKNVKNNKIKPKGLIYISEEFHNKKTNSQLKTNDIVMVQSGHIGECTVITDEYNDSNCHALIVMTPNDNVDSYFYSYYFYSKEGKKSIYKITTGNTIKHILTSDLKPLKIVSPNYEEQQKIASFLSLVDEKIENIKEKKKSLEEYKKGVIQKVFKQEIRFKDENGESFGEWEEKKLGDILEYEQPTKYIVDSTEYKNDYQIPVLTAGKTFILGYTNEDFGIFETKYNPIIIFDDFTTSKQFVNFDFKVKSSAMKILKNIDDKVSNIKYIFELMETIKFNLGDEHKRFWISEYSKVKILLPSLPEQEKIADFLSGIDEKIESVGSELEKMEEFKRGLLQGMFI